MNENKRVITTTTITNHWSSLHLSGDGDGERVKTAAQWRRAPLISEMACAPLIITYFKYNSPSSRCMRNWYIKESHIIIIIVIIWWYVAAAALWAVLRSPLLRLVCRSLACLLVHSLAFLPRLLAAGPVDGQIAGVELDSAGLLAYSTVTGSCWLLPMTFARSVTRTTLADDERSTELWLEIMRTIQVKLFLGQISWQQDDTYTLH